MPSRDPVIKRLQGQRYYERNRERILANGRKSDRKRRAAKRAYLREWVKKNPEKRRLNSERFRLRNAASLAIHKRSYYLKNRARLLLKQKRYYEANRAKCIAGTAAYHKSLPKEVTRKWHATSSARNKKRMRLKKRAYAIAYYYKNQEACKARAKYYAYIRKRRIKWLGDKRDTAEMVGFMLSVKSDPSVKCSYCQSALFGKPIHFDHRIPISRGGGNVIENLCPSCPPCNQQKRDKTPEEFEQYRKEMA